LHWRLPIKSLILERRSIPVPVHGARCRPVSVADDGVKTFFEFSGEIPGIFAVKPDGSETLVNYRREASYIVVDKVSRQWTLRSGSVVTCVFNMKLTGKRVALASFGGRQYDH